MACVQDTLQGGWRTNREQDLPTTLRLSTLSSHLCVRLILINAQAEHDPQFAWVTRHTWQSWRERYKKHAHRLDRVIESIVEHKKPLLGEKGQYGYVRVEYANDKESKRVKFVLVVWIGENTKVMRKARVSVESGDVKRVLAHHSIAVTAGDKAELEEDDIVKRLRKAGGADYNGGLG